MLVVRVFFRTSKTSKTIRQNDARPRNGLKVLKSYGLKKTKQALGTSAIDREFREVREALPTFIPKLSTFIKLPKLPNKLASSRHYPICRQKVVDATLGKKNADGLYYGVLPIGIFFC